MSKYSFLETIFLQSQIHLRRDVYLCTTHNAFSSHTETLNTNYALMQERDIAIVNIFPILLHLNDILPTNNIWNNLLVQWSGKYIFKCCVLLNRYCTTYIFYSCMRVYSVHHWMKMVFGIIGIGQVHILRKTYLYHHHQL